MLTESALVIVNWALRWIRNNPQLWGTGGSKNTKSWWGLGDGWTLDSTRSPQGSKELISPGDSGVDWRQGKQWSLISTMIGGTEKLKGEQIKAQILWRSRVEGERTKSFLSKFPVWSINLEGIIISWIERSNVVATPYIWLFKFK